MGKIKVVWVTEFLNSSLRKHLHDKKDWLYYLENIISKSECQSNDLAQWVSNGISEMEHFNDIIDLHIVGQGYGVTTSLLEYEENGIHYHIYRDQRYNILVRIAKKLLRLNNVYSQFRINRMKILKIINKISPDIIQYIGIENTYYSLSALNIPKTIPMIIQLQTLISDEAFFKNYPIDRDFYNHKAKAEKKIIQRADYIATKDDYFKSIISSEIKQNACYLDFALALTEPLRMRSYCTEYDFVYFSKDIDKAADYAIEAFAIAHKKHPEINLHIVGGYSDQYKSIIDNRSRELGVYDCITYTGNLPTHDDVINEIRKCSFAVIPLKIDLISGTVREAMANSMPTVTTITPATPSLNDKRESILLSKKGDYEEMAANMCKLVEDSEFADKISKNAYITSSERSSNRQVAEQWIKCYQEIFRSWNRK